MKKLLLTSLLILPGIGCLWPNLNSKLPVNGGWVLSNTTVVTPWGSWHADLIKSVENQQTNLPPIMLLSRPGPNGSMLLTPAP